MARRTTVQLVVLAIVTLLGATFVGARYAQLDRFLWDKRYTVVAHSRESGGIYVGGEVTYRGVKIGAVSALELTDDGVDVYLEIGDEWDEIPSDTIAVVGNRSAVGEQYVELRPTVDGGPYLAEGSQITQVATPVQSEKLLSDAARTLASVDSDALDATVDELGAAFVGSGVDLQRIIDASDSFIQTANENFKVTTNLIDDANTVLQGQADSASSLQRFAHELHVFSRGLANADNALRDVIDSGSFTAAQLRTFVAQNESEISDLLANVTTTGRVVVANVDGIRLLLILYPTALERSFSVITRNPQTGLYDTHAGLVLTPSTPCFHGYEGTDSRGPQSLEPRDMSLEAHCAEPAYMSNPRGYQNLPRAGTELEVGRDRNGLPHPLGSDSWQWFYLAPLQAVRGRLGPNSF